MTNFGRDMIPPLTLHAKNQELYDGVERRHKALVANLRESQERIISGTRDLSSEQNERKFVEDVGQDESTYFYNSDEEREVEEILQQSNRIMQESTSKKN